MIIVFTISKAKLNLAPHALLRCYSWSVSTKPGKYFVTGSGAVSLPPDVAECMTVVPNLGCTISITLIPGSGPQVSNINRSRC